jgi:succinoglycan biosynthesis protein ExoA
MARIDTIVAIPTLNEAQHIEAAIKSLRRDRDGARRFELWVVDGGSDDGTIGIVERLSQSQGGVRLLRNPERTQASATNLAAREAARLGGIVYLVRADAHAGYPSGWTAQLIETAQTEGADSVVVPMRTSGGGQMRDASADLFNSWLGHGGSPHRTGRMRGFVEHGHHALFRLDAFLEAGGYDPLFLANEDAELDVRLRKLGRRIFLENRATIDYVPRDSLGGVYRQFYRNGKFRLRTSLKHGAPLGPRQLAPIGLSVMLIGSSVLGALAHPLFFAPAALYALIVFASAGLVASRKTPMRIWLIAVTAMAAHLAFGLGALSTLASHFRDRAPVFARRPRSEAALRQAQDEGR